MKTRILVGVVIAALYLFVFVLGSTLVQAIAVAVFAIFSHYEMTNAIKDGGHKPMVFGGYVFAALLMPAAYFVGSGALFALLVLVVTIIMSVRVFLEKVTTSDMLWSMLPLAYPLLFFGVMALTVSIGDPMGRLILVYTIAVVCCTDMLAYFVGMAIGKHKLSPKLSPKKSIEGAAGGLFGGMIAGLAMYYLQGYFNVDLPLWAYLAFAPVCSVWGQVGDLAASAIKRLMNIKDYSHLFPGHGGVLDRFDSLLFALPVVYCAYSVALSMGWL